MHLEAATIIGQRLAATNRDFSNSALLFGSAFDGAIVETIAREYPGFRARITAIGFPENDALLPIGGLEEEHFDLVISIFDLHWMNDLAGVLVQINRAMKADGLFIAAFPAAGTLTELRQSIIQAELEINAGAGPRIDPFPQLRQLGDLVQRTGFTLPVADLESRTIRYSNIDRLVADLRDCGATASPAEPSPVLTSAIWDRACEIYRSRHGSDGKLPATIEIAFVSGWKEHKSQQKPLKPGTAQKPLSDVL